MNSSEPVPSEPLLSQEQIDELGRFDSPTIANAIDALHVRDSTQGYASLDLRCIYPDLPPIVGYAVTCMDDTSTPRVGPSPGYRRLYEAISQAPKPVVVVFKSVGDRTRSLHMGDVMGATVRALGAVAVVTDGGIRDISAVRTSAPGLQMFAAGAVAAGGAPFLVDVNIAVTICGLTINPGDLLHGDENGLVSIPVPVAGLVADRAKEIVAKERDLVGFINSDEFTLEELFRRRQKAAPKPG